MSTEPLDWLQSIRPELPQISEKYRVAGADSSVAALIGNLSSLNGYLSDFANCFLLLNSSYLITQNDQDNAWIYMQWGIIAAKQAVVVLYNFRAVLNGLNSERRRDSKFYCDMNNYLFEKVRDEFKGKFPHTQELRQAIMHQGELQSNAERSKKNQRHADAVKDNQFIGRDVNASLINYKLLLAFNGSLYDLDVTMENVNFLKSLADMTIDSFSAYYE